MLNSVFKNLLYLLNLNQTFIYNQKNLVVICLPETVASPCKLQTNSLLPPHIQCFH